MKSNSTWVISVLYFGGIIILIIGGLTFLNAFNEKAGATGFIIVIASVGVAIPFFFFAQVLHNLIEQTELLKEIRLNTSRIKNKEEIEEAQID